MLLLSFTPAPPLATRAKYVSIRPEWRILVALLQCLFFCKGYDEEKDKRSKYRL
jgi:hypothetical protein